MRSGPSLFEIIDLYNTPERRDRAVRLAWISWGAFFLAVCLTFFWKETGLPVNHAYACGAQNWLDHRDLYSGDGGFIYLPQSAIVYTPFYWLNGAWEQILWRFVMVGLFAAGVFRLSRLAGKGTQIEFFPLVTLMVLPKTWTCAYSGQATLAMAGLSMLALVEIDRRRWGLAAGLLIAALAFKPLAFVLLLLAAALYAPLRSRLAVGLILFFVAPYATQDAAYVSQQYLAAIPMFENAVKIGLTAEWAQVFSLSQLAGWPVPTELQTVVRIAAAVGVLLLCRRVCRPVARSGVDDGLFSAEPAWLTILSLATAYLLLFNPRTENNTYVLLAPVLGIHCVYAGLISRQCVRCALTAAAAVSIVAGHEFCNWVTPTAGFVWVCPLVCLGFAVHCVWNVVCTTIDVSIPSLDLSNVAMMLPQQPECPCPAETQSHVDNRTGSVPIAFSIPAAPISMS